MTAVARSRPPNWAGIVPNGQLGGNGLGYRDPVMGRKIEMGPERREVSQYAGALVSMDTGFGRLRYLQTGRYAVERQAVTSAS